jgi:tRNA(Ile)-lysidine synthase
MQQVSCHGDSAGWSARVITDSLFRRLAELEEGRRPSRYLVAFSGGLDSTVLLHALAQLFARHGTPIVAVHVNHALQPDADRWEGHCRRFAEALGVEYRSCRVAVPENDRRGPEGAARGIRYAAIGQLVQAGDHVLTAHHEEDQAETLLLNLLRGSGAAGLAGIGAVQPFGAGLLLRPLLEVPRAELEAYAKAHGLAWCDDPSNKDLRFDRNFLREEILPALARRWPAASARLCRSAGLLGETNELLAVLAELDLPALGDDPGRLPVSGLRRLTPARQRNVLRQAIRRAGLPPAPATRLYQAVGELLPAPPDAQPAVAWPGGQLRRYRDTLYVQSDAELAVPSAALILQSDGRETFLGAGLGTLTLERGVAGGIDPRLVGDGLRIRFREGGEKLRPAGREHTLALKNLLQEAGVVPWMRGHIPLLYANGKLVAVADLWTAEEAACRAGYAVRWKDKPRLD